MSRAIRQVWNRRFASSSRRASCCWSITVVTIALLLHRSGSGRGACGRGPSRPDERHLGAVPGPRRGVPVARAEEGEVADPAVSHLAQQQVAKVRRLTPELVVALDLDHEAGDAGDHPGRAQTVARRAVAAEPGEELAGAPDLEAPHGDVDVEQAVRSENLPRIAA